MLNIFSLANGRLFQEEIEALEEPELIEKYRLSCQIRVQNDLMVRVARRSHEQGIPPGPRPED